MSMESRHHPVLGGQGLGSVGLSPGHGPTSFLWASGPAALTPSDLVKKGRAGCPPMPGGRPLPPQKRK